MIQAKRKTEWFLKNSSSPTGQDLNSCPPLKKKKPYNIGMQVIYSPALFTYLKTVHLPGIYKAFH